jgi:hypothetical protein
VQERVETKVDSDKLQELSIIAQDKIRSTGSAWWYALFGTLILCIPVFFVLRTSFASIMAGNHKYPAYIYVDEEKKPLEIIDKKVFQLSPNSYSGYIRVKNINFEYGTPEQSYTATFYTTGGTEVTSVNTQTYILPSSEKIIIFPRFTSDKKPTEMQVNLKDTKFIHAPSRTAPNLELQRTSLQTVENQFVVFAAIKNKTPFTIKQVGLPVLLYDKDNKIVGVNYTNINDLNYLETRSFQFTWPSNPNAIRAEILPEVNIFDNGIYLLTEGSSQFDLVPDNNNF